MSGWPKEVKVLGHVLPVWESEVALKERTASVKWYTQAIALEPLEIPEPPPRIRWRRFSAWEVRRDEIKRINREMLEATKQALAEQLAHICRCPPKAVVITLRRYDPLQNCITVIGKAPAVAWNDLNNDRAPE